jgi:hypothetical protein
MLLRFHSLGGAGKWHSLGAGIFNHATATSGVKVAQHRRLDLDASARRGRRMASMRRQAVSSYSANYSLIVDAIKFASCTTLAKELFITVVC